MMPSSRSLGLVLLVLQVVVHAQEPTTPYTPKIAPASDEGQRAIGGFRVPKGLDMTLFAAEPRVANPVAFSLDDRGRLFVCETFRQERGVVDNRGNMHWLLDDLSLQTVEDRLEMFRKHLGKKVQDYAIEHDRLRLLEDTDGDGTADRSTVFADGFNGILDGTGAGVLVRRGKVYYTCIPKLWQLSDADGDGVADHRKALHHGYGVRVAFRGHDLHGLIMGPDGRLYFSIGDRGYNITTGDGRRLVRPDTGAVFRCEPDGSGLEVFAYGFRNPQELAFDDHGNLFTGDNNSDSGDRARWVYVVEGGDTGWRMYYQYLKDRGPWNRERIWYPYRADPKTAAVQPAATIPPITNLGDGPSGLVCYPGVGLSDRYQGHFFLSDFRGTRSRSGIRSFAMKPKGASFELVDSHKFLWQILATDVDFDLDGRMYISDWVNGWTGLGKGRIYRVQDPLHAVSGLVARGAQALRSGFQGVSNQATGELLAHPDRRVRTEAQYQLVEQGQRDLLAGVALSGTNQLARLHAIWGLGQLARRGDWRDTAVMTTLLNDGDAEVRSQMARVLGDAAAGGKGSDAELREITSLLGDTSPRVRYFAAMAVGHYGHASAVDPLLRVLDENRDEDPMLRHAAVMGLVGIGRDKVKSLLAVAGHPVRFGRLGVLLALGRLGHPGVARYLDDPEPSLQVAAARAIHDEAMLRAYPALARVRVTPASADALARRVLNANFRLGGSEQVAMVAQVASDEAFAESLRLEAVAELRAWTDPSPLDRVLGAYRPLAKRSTTIGLDEIGAVIPALLSGSARLRKAGVDLATHYKVGKVGPLLVGLVGDTERSAEVRVAALGAVVKLKQPERLELVREALNDPVPELRTVARQLLAGLEPAEALPHLKQALAEGTLREQQGALAVLGTMRLKASDAVLDASIGRLVSGEAPVAIRLDILQAALKRGNPAMRLAVAKYRALQKKQGLLARWSDSLEGGTISRGREIFFGRSAVACRRCHTVKGTGGRVGPDLSKIGLEKKRPYLLESIVLPNKQIAKGFETTVVATEAGKVHVGIVRADDGKTLTLVTADGKTVRVPKDEIDEQTRGKSAMPEDAIKHLSATDVRDLVAYLASLKQAPAKK